MEKKRKEKMKHTLTSMQEVAYNHEFKMADRAGGFATRKSTNR
ncbi:YfhE family protein [Mesobacillus foraminis]|nr:YfhE family protein [Mesobacillus foraminis]